MTDPNSHHATLTDEAAHILRAIVFEFNVPISKVAGLWGYFYVLILRLPIPFAEFCSDSTLLMRFQRLSCIDRYLFHQELEEYFATACPYGFKKFWYHTSDDSQHQGLCGKTKRHALLGSGAQIVPYIGTGTPEPVIRHLTSGEAAAGDSASNAILDMVTFMAVYSLQVLACYGGGTTDNAGDAMLETVVLFSLVMAALAQSGIPGLVAMVSIYGVTRLPLLWGDWFHIDNLIVTHASLASSGPTDRDNHSEIHPRQLLQSFHDVRKVDPVLSQTIMDRVLAGTDNKIKLRSNRERQQRWQANQKSTARVLEYMKI